MSPSCPFTQPLCGLCWYKANPLRVPVQVTGSPPEKCCKCGFPTESGIYIRVDPATVRYPDVGELTMPTR